MVEAMEEVNVVALESWERLKMNTYCCQRTTFTQAGAGQTDPEESHQVWTDDLSQHEALSKALDTRFSAF